MNEFVPEARFGRVDRSNPGLIGFGVVGAKQVNITRRTQSCRTRDNGESRDSGRSYPALVPGSGYGFGAKQVLRPA
jgi:hypothetical protein